jgi:hypothetical protein
VRAQRIARRQNFPQRGVGCVPTGGEHHIFRLKLEFAVRRVRAHTAHRATLVDEQFRHAVLQTQIDFAFAHQAIVMRAQRL